jgi:hypothetical protein
MSEPDRKRLKTSDGYSVNLSSSRSRKSRENASGEEFSVMKDKNADKKAISTYWQKKFLPRVQGLIDSEHDSSKRDSLQEGLYTQAYNIAMAER